MNVADNVKTGCTHKETSFIEHLQDWVDYLCKLLDESGEMSAKIKYERQLRWMLAFHDGINVSVKHNILLDDIYNKTNLASYDAPKASQLDCIQQCYSGGGHAFEQIKKALSCPSLFFLQGPPGTGKTTAIVEIILQTLAKKTDARILVASETHVAVDNALDKLTTCLGHDAISKVYRHKEFSAGSQLNNPVALKVVLTNKANDLWSKAHDNSPVLTEALWERLGGDREKVPMWLAKNIADKSQIIGVTCNQIEHLIDSNSLAFDLAIVDEVSKATLPEWIMAISNAQKAILVGDHKQLPATFCGDESEVLEKLSEHQERLIRDGVVDRLFENSPSFMRGMLTTQYRMQPNIGAFISEAFYNNQLSHGREQTENTQTNFGWLKYDWNGYFPDKSLHKDKQVLVNDAEVEVIRKALFYLNEKSYPRHTIALITPYKAQAKALRLMVGRECFENLSVEVDTVDAFQGREADTVFFSFVRNNGSAKFYGDSRRINVALSRARERVYLVGDQRYLRNQTKYPVIKELLKLRVVAGY